MAPAYTVCRHSPGDGSGNNKRYPPAVVEELILALQAAGGLSPVILARSDAEERFNRHWSSVPSSEDVKEAEQRSGGRGGVGVVE